MMLSIYKVTSSVHDTHTLERALFVLLQASVQFRILVQEWRKVSYNDIEDLGYWILKNTWNRSELVWTGFWTNQQNEYLDFGNLTYMIYIIWYT